MATRVMVGVVKDKRKSVASAVLYDSATMTAFGPVLTVESVATNEDMMELGEDFIDFVEKNTLGKDPSTVPTKRLHALFAEFLASLGDGETQAGGAKKTDELEEKGGAA